MARSQVETIRLLAFWGATLAAGCRAPAPQPLAPPGPASPAEAKAPGGAIGAAPKPGGRVGLHGMVVFGGAGGPVFFSHIPMFHGPHDMQAIVEVRLDAGPPRFDTGLFTFKPTPFSLDDLALGRLATVSGTLYEGNFEQGGRPIGEARAGVLRVVVARPLDGRAQASDALGGRVQAPEALEYTALGSRASAFLVHRISRAPDFDQIIAVDVGQTSLSDEALRAGVTLVVSGRKNGVDERLQAGSVGVEVKGNVRAGLAEGGGGPERRGEPGGRVEVRRVLSTLVGPEFVDGP
jgi:hypothetical protein